MRRLASFVTLSMLSAATLAAREPQEPPSAAQARDGFAIGVLASPALEAGGPWFMPGIRISAPLGAKHGLDVDSGVIFGATHKYAAIKSFLAAQIRFSRPREEGSTTAKYWLAGLRYIPLTKLNQDNEGSRRTEDVALLIGYGWKETFANNTRVLSEIGFAGGGGFMIYATIGVQFGPPPPKKARRGNG